MPVIRETAFRAGRISLTEIPVSPDFRYTIRIYSLDSSIPGSAHVRIYGLHAEQQFALAPDVALGEATLPLALPAAPADNRPGYLEVRDVSAIASITNYTAIRVDIEPVGARLLLWAFATVTSNVTQNVTVLEPVR